MVVSVIDNANSSLGFLSPHMKKAFVFSPKCWNYNLWLCWENPRHVNHMQVVLFDVVILLWCALVNAVTIPLWHSSHFAYSTYMLYCNAALCRKDLCVAWNVFLFYFTDGQHMILAGSNGAHWSLLSCVCSVKINNMAPVCPLRESHGVIELVLQKSMIWLLTETHGCVVCVI